MLQLVNGEIKSVPAPQFVRIGDVTIAVGEIVSVSHKCYTVDAISTREMSDQILITLKHGKNPNLILKGEDAKNFEKWLSQFTHSV
jgi:hypothetical protein